MAERTRVFRQDSNGEGDGRHLVSKGNGLDAQGKLVATPLVGLVFEDVLDEARGDLPARTRHHSVQNEDAFKFDRVLAFDPLHLSASLEETPQHAGHHIDRAHLRSGTQTKKGCNSGVKLSTRVEVGFHTEVVFQVAWVEEQEAFEVGHVAVIFEELIEELA